MFYFTLALLIIHYVSPTTWLSNWCNREKKRTRDKDSPVLDIRQFKLETDDTIIPPPAKRKKRTRKKDLTSESSTPTDPSFKPQDSFSSAVNAAAVPSHQPLLYDSSGYPQVYPEPYPVSALHRLIPRPDSYNTTSALEPLQSTNLSVYRPISLPLSAYNDASDLSDAHLMSQAAPLKYLPVLQDPNVTDSLLDERLVQQDPFQAAMGLVYLSRRGLRW
ncbi:hypothetical protein BDZ89DRAFT_1141070 [Hymenopellis radicata]|nr:hypothetical protein BDZ89DRAFT_1141070 [Hymenopellis radicata]